MIVGFLVGLSILTPKSKLDSRALECEAAGGILLQSGSPVCIKKESIIEIKRNP